MSDVLTYSKVHEKFFEEHGELIDYKKGYPLVWSNDDVPWVFFLKSGIVKTTISPSDSPDILLGYFVPGCAFAQAGSFFNNKTVGISYEATTPCSVYRVRSDEFWNQLETDSEFTLDYLRCVLRYNLILVDRIAYQNEKGIRAKVSKWLLFMSKYYGENDGNTSTIYIPLTQETISEFLHCSRESVSITLAEMTREGIVSTRKKLITIHDLSRLSAS